ncbi:MAG TPA: amidohydrolase family protein [Candidatus Sulfotelmatobacter sp.]
MEILLVLAAFAFLNSGSLFAQQKSDRAKERFALVGGQVYPDPFSKPISDAIVLIENGKITAVGKKDEVHVPLGVEVVDCAGRTIVSGFWNSHVHFMEPKWEGAASLPATQLDQQLQQMLTRYGFTSVVDTGSALPNTVAIRRRIETSEVLGPRILTAGFPLYPKDGVPYYVAENVPADLVKLLPQPATPEEAVRAVDENIAAGADIIKLFVVSIVSRDGKHVALPMSLPIVQAITAEAHRRGKLVFAHPSTNEGVEIVLQGNVDVLAHTTEDPVGWSATTVDRLKSANVSLIPTLTLFSGENGPDANHLGILEEVKSYSDAGGQILFGTDIGYLTRYPLLTKEYELLGRAGLTFPQILAALTTTPAKRLGFAATTGRVANGQDADLVILDGDPADDLRAFSRVKMTLRRGRIIYRAQLQ